MNCEECKKEYIGKEQEQTICCSCSEKKIKIGKKITDFLLGLLFMAFAWLFVVMVFGGTYTN